MNQIQQLVKNEFAILKLKLNGKIPILEKWTELTNEQLVKNHGDYTTLNWGLRMGLQENGKYVMSFDFDCCGKENKLGVRVPCEYTINTLQEYLSIRDRADGFYNSSTQGNAVLLIDYTKCLDIIDKISMTKQSHLSHKSFEVLVGKGHQQVLPPSQTVCKISKKMGEKRKWENDVPFYELDENSPIYPYVEAIIDKMTEKPKVLKIKRKTKTEQVAEEIKTDFDDKFIDLLFNVIKNERDENGVKIVDEKDFSIIGAVLKNNGYELETYKKWCEPIANPRNSTATIKWNGIKHKEYPMTNLYKIAERVNPDGLAVWRAKNPNFFIESNKLDQPLYVAETISKTLQNELIFKNKTWYGLNSLMIWKPTDSPHAQILSHLIKYLDASNLELSKKISTADGEDKERLIEYQKKLLAYYPKIQKPAFVSMLMNCLKSYLLKIDIVFDDYKYKIFFQNGYIDMTQNKFIPKIKSSDYITKTIAFDYELANDDDKAHIQQQLLKICNNNVEHLQYYLSSLGYAFTGDSEREQAFWAWIGQTASNGKSVVLDSLSAIIPNYVKQMVRGTLDEGFDIKKEMATWGGLKILWANELSTKKKDADLMKAIADGTVLKFNKMYATEAEEVKIGFKMCVVSNNTVKVNADAGIQRRFKLCQFNSSFQEEYTEDNYETLHFVKNKDFPEELKTIYKHALLQLIFDYSFDYFKNGMKPYPEDWNEEKKMSVADNNKNTEWLEDNLTFGDGLVCGKGEIETRMGQDKKYFNLKDELKKMKAVFQYQSDKRHKGKKGLYTGFELKMLEENDCDV